MHLVRFCRTAVLATLFVVALAPSAFAQLTFDVISTLDEIDADTGDGFCLSTPSGVCTLRAAIMQANASLGPDNISLMPGTYTLSLGNMGEDAGAEGDLDISDDVSIFGTGQPGDTVIDADGIDRVFHILGAAQVQMTALTVRGGFPDFGEQGGGILIDDGSATFQLIVVRENQADEEGGGIALISGTLTLLRSSLIDNLAFCGGGLHTGGSQATLENVTVSGNEVICVGGGVLASAGNTDISYSTFVGNVPENIADESDTLTLTLTNTLMVPAAGFDNCDIAFVSGSIDGGGNFAGIEDCDTILATTDAELVQSRMEDPDSGQFVHRPLAGNPAIGNAVSPCPPSLNAFDQRGIARPQPDLGNCDSGAVELRAPAIISAAPPDALWNTPYVHNFAGGFEGPVTFALQTPGTLPSGLSLSTAGVISGATTVLGTANFTVEMTDVVGQIASQATSITVTGTAASVTGTPAAATWNSPYSFAFTGTGNGALSYAVTAGSLPAGLVMSTVGIVSGTPTGIGQSFFIVTVTDASGQTDDHTTSLTVNGTAVSVTGTPPGATWNQAYNFTFSGTGNGTLSFTVTLGSLPNGLSLSTAGVVSGTPTGLGTSPFTVRVTDQTGQFLEENRSIAVTGTPANITGTPPGATWNTAYSFAFTGSGNGALSFARTAGSLPAGLSLSSTGVVTGTPSQLGFSSFTVTMTDQTGQTNNLPTSISVTGTPAALTGTPPDVSWNTFYSFAFTGAGNGTRTYALTAGSLPAGLSLSSAGVVTGTPTGNLGTSFFTVTMTDQTNQVESLPTGITVTGADVEFTNQPPDATWGVAYNFAILATGNGALTYAVTAGALPAGLTLSSVGVISGTSTPTTAVGTSVFTVTATDAAGVFDFREFGIRVTGVTMTLSGNPPAATWGVGYTHAFTATGSGTLTFAVIGGALPAGLTISSAGVVSGTPTAGGSTFTLRVTDQIGASISTQRSIAVNGTSVTLTGVPPAAQQGNGYAFAFTATGDGTLTFDLMSGVLPPGLTLSTAGLLFGVPTTAGSYPFRVQVRDQKGVSTSRAVTLIVNAAPTPPSPGPSPPPAGNAPPSVTGLSDFTIEENRPIAPIAITLGDDATPPDQLQVNVAAADATILSNVSLTGTGASRTLNLTLAEDREGQATVTLMVGDGTLTTTVRATITVSPAPVPQPPTGFTGVPEGAGVRFSWQAPVVGAVPTFYVLEGGNQTGLVTLPVVNTGRATNYLLIVPSGTWFFRVRSGNSAGVSIPSAELSGALGGAPTPGAPQALVSSVAGVVAQLAWQPPQEGGPASQWQIEVGSTPGASDRIVLRLPASVFAIQSALDPGHYVARVRGVGASGVGPASNETSFTVGAVAACALGVADPPVLLPATVANRLVTLMWRPPTNSAVANYRIVVGSAPGLSDLITFDVGTVTSFAAVAPPGQYFVRLLAANACGTSLPSNEIFVNVP